MGELTLGEMALGLSELGLGIWSFLFLSAALIVFGTLFFSSRSEEVGAVVARTLSLGSGLLALFALALFLMVATTSGSFHMAPDDTTFAVLLGMVAVSGCSALFWGVHYEAAKTCLVLD